MMWKAVVVTLPARVASLREVLDQVGSSSERPCLCIVLFPEEPAKGDALASEAESQTIRVAHHAETPAPERDSRAALREQTALRLDCSARVIMGLEMEALVAGELRLLQYLGSRPGRWFSTHCLASAVYERNDAAGRQLVWKYASTLRRKLMVAGESSLIACRRRGYCFSKQIVSTARQE